MENDNDIKNQMEILKHLDEELDKYSEKVDELIITKDLEDSLNKCQPKKRAEVYWSAAFGIYTNKYLDPPPSLHSHHPHHPPLKRMKISARGIPLSSSSLAPTPNAALKAAHSLTQKLVHSQLQMKECWRCLVSHSPITPLSTLTIRHSIVTSAAPLLEASTSPL